MSLVWQNHCSLTCERCQVRLIVGTQCFKKHAFVSFARKKMKLAFFFLVLTKQINWVKILVLKLGIRLLSLLSKLYTNCNSPFFFFPFYLGLKTPVQWTKTEPTSLERAFWAVHAIKLSQILVLRLGNILVCNQSKLFARF